MENPSIWNPCSFVNPLNFFIIYIKIYIALKTFWIFQKIICQHFGTIVREMETIFPYHTDINHVITYKMKTIYCTYTGNLLCKYTPWLCIILSYSILVKIPIQYHFDIIPKCICQYRARNTGNVSSPPLINVKRKFFKNSFFAPTIVEQNEINLIIQNLVTIGILSLKIQKVLNLLQTVNLFGITLQD